MENTKLINCFNDLLLDFMQQGARGSVASFNSIKNGLQIVINISSKKGPVDEMSLVYVIMPEIMSIVNEKSDDFSTDILMIHEAQENFENFFNAELSDPDPLGENMTDFISFIKEKKKYMKKEIEILQNMEKIIHDQKEKF